MRILQLCTYERGGGAEKVALDLHHAYRALGHDARMLVRHSKQPTDGVYEADAYAHTAPWGKLAGKLDAWVAGQRRFRGQYRVRDWLRRTAWPQRWIALMSGAEDVGYPYAGRLLDTSAPPTAAPGWGAGWTPDVIHAHNLHGDYFDLRALAPLSRRIPVVWTLHDAWALTGHCAYFIDCGRWRSGCGSCPDLGRAPAIRRDRTAENWRLKREAYAQSRLAVATPSQWLMDQVEQSMLDPWRRQVIPNGVDRSVYRPGDREEARAALGLPQEAFICMFIATSVSAGNIYKDISTVDRAVRLAREQATGSELLFVCVGAAGESADPHVRYTGYLSDPARVALHYQAADVLLHAANAENYPCVVLEALACGTPVIATAVGGVAEQIDDGESGFLVARGDGAAMAERLLSLKSNPLLRRRMAARAARHERSTFTIERQAGRYLEWFGELREAYAAEPELVGRARSASAGA